ncbi:MAG: cyclase family protein [Deltaproteobacteria bacterium]|nr:cyclase family protein [Deltaproteobacteria bacterium]MBI3075884.1 cyclase family protein [Deltaproteobacteria bacterium]
MRYVDLTHPWGLHTPPFFGNEGPSITYVRRFPVNHCVGMRIETSTHTGTHMDAPMHFVPNGGDMASIPLDRLIGEGVIVDVSNDVREWDEIKPEHLTKHIEIREGDIVLYYTGWDRYYYNRETRDEERYMCRHPGGGRDLAQWIVDMKLRWTGVDAASADHPMNTFIRDRRPDLAREFERRVGRRVEDVYPPEELDIMHRLPFAHRIVHVENLGGDVAQVLNRRCLIGAFPWKFEGGDASICRVVAFLEE